VNAVQISVKRCQGGAIGASALQHICVAAARTVVATAIADSGYDLAIRWFDSGHQTGKSGNL